MVGCGECATYNVPDSSQELELWAGKVTKMRVVLLLPPEGSVGLSLLNFRGHVWQRTKPDRNLAAREAESSSSVIICYLLSRCGGGAVELRAAVQQHGLSAQQQAAAVWRTYNAFHVL